MRPIFHWIAIIVLVCLGSLLWIAHFSVSSGPLVMGDAVLEDARSAHWIESGNGKSLLYVYVDPQCRYCAELHAELHQHLDKTRIRWIPVAVMGEDSRSAAAAILLADDPVREMARAFSGERARGRAINAMANKALIHNFARWRRISGVVPTLVFQAPNGEPRALFGVPDDLEGILDFMSRDAES